MSFPEVLAELSTLTTEQRHHLICKALELDDLPLSPADEALIRERLQAHDLDPTSSLDADEVKARWRARGR